MLITFRCKASPNLMMLDDLATRLLHIIGRELERPGILTVEQLPQALQKLEHAVMVEPHPQTTLHEEEHELPLSLRQRAFPLLSMLRDAVKKGEPITWE